MSDFEKDPLDAIINSEPASQLEIAQMKEAAKELAVLCPTFIKRRHQYELEGPDDNLLITLTSYGQKVDPRHDSAITFDLRSRATDELLFELSFGTSNKYEGQHSEVSESVMREMAATLAASTNDEWALNSHATEIINYMQFILEAPGYSLIHKLSGITDRGVHIADVARDVLAAENNNCSIEICLSDELSDSEYIELNGEVTATIVNGELQDKEIRSMQIAYINEDIDTELLYTNDSNTHALKADIPILNNCTVDQNAIHPPISENLFINLVRDLYPEQFAKSDVEIMTKALGKACLNNKLK